MPTIATTKPTAAALNLEALLGKPAKKPEKKGKEYPLLPDDEDGEITKLADMIRNAQEQADAAETSLKILKGELGSRAAQYYFRVNAGKVDVPSSLAVKTSDPESKPILVNPQNRYSPVADAESVKSLLGEDLYARLFRDTYELKLDGDAIPADKAADFLQALAFLCAEYDCSEALSFKQQVKPTPDFHAARHTLLDAETNLALHALVPCTIVIKASGLGAK